MTPNPRCRRKLVLAALAAFLGLLNAASRADTFSKFYNFVNPTGHTPEGGVVVAGGRVYGTALGGPGQSGVVYSVSTNGSDYTMLHSFASDGSEGFSPSMGVTLIDDTLYGTTSAGDYASGTWRGTVFRVGTNGANFATVHAFAFDTTEGIPDICGPLLAFEGTLYGVSPSGGLNGEGVIYSITPNGEFHLLHTFSDSPTDGSYPKGPLTVLGSTLYGTTSRGGALGFGTVYSINPNGSGFAVLHSFAGYQVGPSEPGEPMSGLTVVGSQLFGSTYYGGSNNVGTIFSMNLDGSGFTVLHHLGTEAIDATDNSSSSLTLVGNQLYGAYRGGGTNLGWGQFIGQGLLFRMNLDGSGFTPLHVFAGAPADGDGPWGGLTLYGNTLYGNTQWGGSSLYLAGSLFSYTLDRIAPNVPAPGLQIATQTQPNSIGGTAVQVTIALTNLVPGTEYRLFRNPDLTTTNWTLSLDFTATNSSQVWKEMPAAPAMFYRARTP